MSLWYLIGAFVWTSLNLVLGSFILPYTIAGINSAAFHGLYIHYIVGLWITPAGYVLIYYFLPLSVRNPLYAHKLSLVGFWSLALFYPFVGIHHYLYSPIADWAETLAIITSMLLIIPVWTVLVNFFGTVNGRWREFGANLPAKFLIMGSIMYLFGCFQGSVEALRSIQQPTHFTDFVISHSHLTVFGTFVVWAMGGLLYLWPRMCGRELWSFKLGNWSFWLITCGISTMGIVLSAAGLQQGFQWMNGAEWVDTVVQMRRVLAGTHAGGDLDGYRDVAPDHQSHDDRAQEIDHGGRLQARKSCAKRRWLPCRPGSPANERALRCTGGRSRLLLPRPDHPGCAALFRALGDHQPRDGRDPQRYRPTQMDGNLGHRLHAAREAGQA